jgi:hypothetical protein
VFALGAVSRAAEKHGLTYTLVLKLLRERGITDYPRVSAVEKMRLAAQTKRARRALAMAGISATPTPQEQEQDMEAAAPVEESVAPRRGRARPGAAADAAGHRPAGRRGPRPGRRARSHGRPFPGPGGRIHRADRDASVLMRAGRVA